MNDLVEGAGQGQSRWQNMQILDNINQKILQSIHATLTNL